MTDGLIIFALLMFAAGLGAGMLVAIRPPKDAHVYFEIAKLGLQPGDVLVLKTNGLLTDEQRHMLGLYVATVAPGVKTMVLDRGFDLAVLHGDRLDFAKKDAAA